MKKWTWVIVFSIISLISYLVWQEFKLSSDFEPKSSNNERIAVISFYTAIAGAFAGFFSLIKEILAIFRERKSGS